MLPRPAPSSARILETEVVQAAPFVTCGDPSLAGDSKGAYEYRDAATLLADFWSTVDAVLRERGVIP